MSGSFRQISLCFGGGVLVLAGLASVFLFRDAPLERATLPMDVFPAALTGWTVTDLDIGGTESMNAAIEEGLGFDDYRYRRYQSAAGEFSVYLAYWSPRRRHFLDVGTHAPDNCWVTNGMTMSPEKRSVELKIPSATIRAGNQRSFEAAGQQVNVIYWHLLGGRAVEYARYGSGKTLGFIWDNRGLYWGGNQAQYFLRISSPQSFALLQTQPGFQAVLEALRRHLSLSRDF